MGLKYRSDNVAIALIMSSVGAFFILMCGLFVLGLGVDFKIGYVDSYSYLTNSSNIKNITSVDSYVTLKGGLDSYGLSYALFFLAFAMFLISYLGFSEGRNKPRDYSEEEE